VGARLYAVIFLPLVMLAGCSSSDPGGTAEPQPVSGAPASGQVRYIVASGAKLQDVAVGGEAREVVSFDDGSTLMDPALSPDGKRIAFIRQEPVKNLPGGQIDFGADLYVVNRDGSGLKEVVHHSALAEYVRGPSWLDADQFFFSVRGRDNAGTADYRVERIDLRSGQRSRVAQNQVDPSVAPGARQLLTISVETSTTRETVLLGGVDGSAVRDLLPQLPVLTLVGSAVMSPDGSQVAFAAGDLAGAMAAPRARAAVHPFFQDIWLINADGSDLRRVAEVVERTLSLSWSPDGRYIYAMGTERFRRVDAVTGEVVVLGEGAQSAGIYFYEGR
jgi:Tol biopolymer transport system component